MWLNNDSVCSCGWWDGDGWCGMVSLFFVVSGIKWLVFVVVLVVVFLVVEVLCEWND